MKTGLGLLVIVLLVAACSKPAPGLIAIIGLAAKDATLIVEFAIEEEAEGKSVLDATLSAMKLRLRPIIMMSLAFIFGMVALRAAAGAGQSRLVTTVV